ncbi:hypothetical protein D3C71_748390 [compost metagenome]
MKFLRVGLSAVLFFASFAFLMVFVIGLTDSALGNSWIGLILAVIFFVAGLLVKGKSSIQKKNVAERENLKLQGATAISKLHHIEGLPLAENTLCNVAVTPTGLIIDGGGTEFKLDTSQIRAAEVKTDVEIANIVHSSAVKGVAGGLLFGPIGLVVGSRATSKEKKSYTYYLIINYLNSNGELSALMFDGGNLPMGAQRIKNKLYPMIQNNPKETVKL